MALTPADLDSWQDGPAYLQTVEEFARSYTRGRGFDAQGYPFRDVREVILAATARLRANPAQVAQTAGPFTVNGGFGGFNLIETQVLNRYRKRAL